MNKYARSAVLYTFLSASVLALSAACGSKAKGTGSGIEGSGPGPNGQSLCVGSCPKACAVDSDCDTAGGDLCCDYGTEFGNACVAATACPRFCKADSDCNTAQGEACCSTNAGTTETVCAKSAACVIDCKSDSDCPGQGQPQDAGFGIPGLTYQCQLGMVHPVCTPSTSYMASCTASSDCNTASGQLCCTTLGNVDPAYYAAGAGLCTSGSLCPVACTADSQCSSSSAGALCCDGFCSTACVTTCTADSQCSATGNVDNGLCCGTAAISSPYWNAGTVTP